MAGGVGSRFWPMSRSLFPKQFHDILGTGKTLLQDTFDRFASFIPKENIYIVTNEKYFNLVKDQLPLTGDHQVLLEPMGRNTAPCVAYAVYKIRKICPEAVFVVAPADHLIQREVDFRTNILLGLEACEQHDMIMTLGIKPTRPDTGYGYIQYIFDNSNKGYYKVKTFTEKPNLEVAKSFIRSGDYIWNGGIFIFSAPVIAKGFDVHLADMGEQFNELTPFYYTAEEQNKVNEVYATCKSISIDYGIMEKAENVYTIPSDFGWSDLGTWGSVYENSHLDEAGNTLTPSTLAYEVKNSVIRSSTKKKILAIKGLDNFIVVDTDDALLICPKDDDQFIKQIVSDTKSRFGEEFV
jgi:mannose-1-phosphate guanylyltransferase